jgi:hypothetical protein
MTKLGMDVLNYTQKELNCCAMCGVTKMHNKKHSQLFLAFHIVVIRPSILFGPSQVAASSHQRRALAQVTYLNI